MRSTLKAFAFATATLLALLPACAPKEAADEAATATTAAPDTVATPNGEAATDMSASEAAAAQEAGTAAPGQVPAAAPGTVLASQETNWPGIVVDVTEFRRKGNTLTAKFRVRNQGTAAAEPAFTWDQVYVMDAAAGKKYEALKDEGGTYIAANRQNWKDRWYDTLDPGQSALLWIKFPAPPPEVKAVTFQLPNTPPFDDLAIQDS